MTSWRRHLLTLARYLGVEYESIGDRGVVLAPRGSKPFVDSVDETTWVVQLPSSSRRSLRQIGPPALRTHMLIDEGAARSHMRQYQARLGRHLAAEHISWVLRKLDINCVLDVGANVGQFARKLRRSGYEGRIASFEPVAEYADRVREESADDRDWDVFDFALGDADSTMEIHARPGSMSSLLPSSDFGRQWHPRLREQRMETITVRRLDGLFESLIAGIDEPRVYLKLDTQGFDLQAFAGIGERVRDIAAMQSEVSCVPIYDGMPRLPEQITVYEDAGFEITGMFPVTRDPATMRVIEFDVVMVRPERLP